MVFKDIVYILRPHQWSKNLLIFAPSFYGAVLFNNFEIFINMILAFICFSLVSSTTYIINDLTDIQKDRQHPVKKHRPIASGRIGVALSMTITIVCLCTSLAISLQFGREFILVSALYLFIGIAYSLLLQYVVIVDAFTIAMGFVLRLLAGGYASHTNVSSWLLLTTFLLSVLLAFGKRRHELSLTGSSEPFRKVLRDYDEQFLDNGIIIFSTCALVTFLIYVVEIGRKEYLLSIPFACYGVMRYLQIVKSRKGVEPTEAFLKDKLLFLSVLLWIFVTGIIIYFKDILNLIK
jgi:decaprenyl-phosphate phosphoribosyltransferase